MSKHALADMVTGRAEANANEAITVARALGCIGGKVDDVRVRRVGQSCLWRITEASELAPLGALMVRP